jgi:hypothetical protein
MDLSITVNGMKFPQPVPAGLGPAGNKRARALPSLTTPAGAARSRRPSVSNRRRS